MSDWPGAGQWDEGWKCPKLKSSVLLLDQTHRAQIKGTRSIYLALVLIRLFLLYGQPFWLTGHFETSASNDPKMTLNTTRSKIPIYMCHWCSRISAFISLYDQSVSRCKLVNNWKCIKWSQNDLEHFMVKSTPYTLKYQRGPNLCLFCSTVRRFRDTRLLKIVKESEMQWMKSDWSWTINSQKYPTYTT